MSNNNNIVINNDEKIQEEHLKEIEELEKVFRRSINTLINHFNKCKDDKIKEILFDTIQRYTEDITKRGFIIDMSISDTYFKFNTKKDNRVPNVASINYFNKKLEYLNYIFLSPYTKTSYRDIFIPIDPFSKYNYDYDPYKNELPYMNTSIVINDEELYKRFIKNLNVEPYVNIKEGTYPEDRLTNYLATEKSFVGSIIYKDDNIIRLRSKSGFYTRYRGIEDYIYYLNKDVNLDFKLLRIDNNELLINIPINQKYEGTYGPKINQYPKLIQNRIKYLRTVRDSNIKDFYDPKKLWLIK